MHGVKILNNILKEMDKMNKDFFWQNNIDSKNNHGAIPLISWDKVCRPKCEGGRGIRKVQDVNAASLAKLGWKVLKDPNNLWVRVVSAKYLAKSNFLEAKKSANASRMWKYILDHRYLLKKRYSLVSGEK